MKKEQIIELDITDLNNLGCGVGRYEGMVVFVKGAVAGDRVRAKIIKVNKSFSAARLEEIITPSPVRIKDDPCKAPLACGGCVYRHITYEHEKDIKRGFVKSAFAHSGLVGMTIDSVVAT